MQRWSRERYRLDTRFVHLTLLLDQGPDAEGVRFQPTREQFHDLHAVLERLPDDPAVVVLGPPGAGKSTLLRHYELDLADAALHAGEDLGQQPLTFFVALSDYRSPASGAALPLPMPWLATRWQEAQPDLPPLEALLRTRRLTLLLDALNEMPIGLIPRWRDWLHDVVRQAPGTRVVFSCRSLDYSVTLASKTLPVPQVRIEALDDAQVAEFLRCYCPEAAVAEALWQQLRGTPQLDLYRSPYYLKLLVQQSANGHLPRGRAALFTGFVWQALQREVVAGNPLFQPEVGLLAELDRQRLQDYRQPTVPALPEIGPLIPRLSALAWQMQQRGPGPESTQVCVAHHEAVTLLDHPAAADMLKAAEELGLLDRDPRQYEVRYVHQLLQEYCAARHLTQAPQPSLVHQPWRARPVETPRGWLGRWLPSRTPPLPDPDIVLEDLQTTLAGLADNEPLPRLPSTGWEETTVLAAAMTAQPDAFVAALMAVNLPLAGRCAAQPDVSVSEALTDRLRQALVQRTQDPQADLRARIAAGEALGLLGDPRFTPGRGPQGAAYLLPPFVSIPGGTYRIGSDEGLYAAEAPEHAVTLAPFALAKFPVTNAEWALFMQAGGYEDERWWEGEAAQQWQRGEGTAEGVKRQWREYRQAIQRQLEEVRQWPKQGRVTRQELEAYETWAGMGDEAFEVFMDTTLRDQRVVGQQTEPAWWTDDAFNNPAQPVVGICWYEALAYCAWLSAQTGMCFRLPTEAEWEAAARGMSGRRYAYSNTFEASYGNTFETHIRRTTPVGVFPGGETPEGLVDMKGNTWDWTSSGYQDYPYDASDGREDLYVNLAGRVARGGSWGGGPLHARASCRNHIAPGSRGLHCGLRVVLIAP